MKFTQALIEVRRRVGTLVKDQFQSHQKYKYLSHDQVTDVVVSAMHEVGIVHMPTTEEWSLSNGTLTIKVKCDFYFTDGGNVHTIESSWIASDQMRSGTTAGALASYAVKTCLLKAFGIPTGDSDLEDHTELPPMKQPEVSTPDADEIAAKLRALMKAVDLDERELLEIEANHGGVAAFWKDVEAMKAVGRDLRKRLGS